MAETTSQTKEEEEKIEREKKLKLHTLFFGGYAGLRSVIRPIRSVVCEFE